MPPLRGLVSLHNLRRQPFRLVDVHRWINYCCLAFRVQKIDVLALGTDADRLQNLLLYAREFQASVSLRIDASEAVFELQSLADEGLQDVLLVSAAAESSAVMDWLQAAHAAHLPVRLQLLAPFPVAQNPMQFAEEMKRLGVYAVSVLPDDPLAPATAYGSAEGAKDAFEWIRKLAEALREQQIELNLFGFPLEPILADIREVALPLAHFFEDHQQYHRDAFDLASRLFRRHPKSLQALMQVYVTRTASHESGIDRWMTLLLEKYVTRVQYPVVFLRQVARLMLGRQRMVSVEPAQHSGADPAPLDPSAFSRIFPGVSGVCPQAATFPRMRYFDALDAARLDVQQERTHLQEEALAWEREGPAKRVHDSSEIDFYGAVAVRMPGANELITLKADEKKCHILPWVTLPFMVQCTFGGGLAEGIGFAMGRHIRIMCPMVLPNHRLHLYADERGRYVLLRDGQAVEPMALEGRHYVPPRMPSGMHLQISTWNIKERLTVSGVRMWEREGGEVAKRAPVKYSVVIFCTRFARRLETALRCIAHQQDYPLDQIEVLVAYVPGVDATEDVIDSVRLAWPELKVLHMPFPAHNLNSKGFAINEMVGQSIGDWIMILDSDTLLPPDFFCVLEKATDSHDYITPRGRAMLEPATTARVLLGEVKPWESWEALLSAAPEFREKENVDSIPVGYCQIMRRSCFEAIRYNEYEHFQGADYEFSDEMIKRFGKEHRLDAAVLHLHHGGRQWYGTRKQY
jgi:hypothetical protein